MSREMRHSGIEWIGEIPKEWKICRLKDVGTLYGGLTGKAGDDFNVEEDDISYMLYIPFTNIFNNDSINPNQLFKVKIEQGEKQNLVQKGDLLFLMSSEDYDGVGKPAIMEEQVDNLGLNSFCKGLRIYNNNTNSKFLFYLLSSHLHRELVRQEAKGFIRINLRQDRLSCCPIFLPPLSEQQKIANYLDKVCGEVDEMIALQEQMIEELKAYKQSVITEAVTKGLNPNVPMKDSGIDWIGEVPEEWSVEKLKYLISKIESGVSVNAGNVPASKNEIGVLKTSCVSKYIFDANENKTVYSNEIGRVACPVRANTIIVSRMNTPELVGACGYVNEDYDNIYLPDRLWQVHFHDVCVKYIWFVLRSSHIRNYYSSLSVGSSSSMQNISQDQFANATIVLPPLSEQQTIASYLDTKCSEIDALIAIKQAKIDELKDYKKSIIYEYVTGKKEVV